MAKSPYDIEPNATFIEAATTSVRAQLDELLNNLEGTRAGDDIEALHDMRVASRRLRAALSVFAEAFPTKQFRPLEREVARVTDALGAVRDSDVLIEFMEEATQRAPLSSRVGLEAFANHLKTQRDEFRIDLVKELNRLEKSKFKKDFDAMLGDSNKEAAKHG